MIEKSLTAEGKEKIVRYIGEVYQRSRRRMDVYEFQNCVHENQQVYDCDQGMVHLIDRTLADCSPETRCIIRREYLEAHRKSWYTEYFSKTAYYRLKKIAVVEFIDCLDI